MVRGGVRLFSIEATAQGCRGRGVPVLKGGALLGVYAYLLVRWVQRGAPLRCTPALACHGLGASRRESFGRRLGFSSKPLSRPRFQEVRDLHIAPGWQERLAKMLEAQLGMMTLI